MREGRGVWRAAPAVWLTLRHELSKDRKTERKSFMESTADPDRAWSPEEGGKRRRRYFISLS